jgi:hypothetical protein
LERRLDGRQSQFRRFGANKNLLPYRELNPGRPALILSFCQLSYPGSWMTELTEFYFEMRGMGRLFEKLVTKT